MKLCVLHCGQPKTGSNSLQTYLAANATALAGQGVLYPVLTLPAGSPAPLPWITSYHGRAMQLVSNGVKKPRAGSLLDQLHKHIAETPHEVLLLSAEGLFKELFYNRKNMIGDYLTAAGYRIETVTYLRDQSQRLASAYAQECKIGQFHGTFDAFCDAMQRPVAPGEALEANNLHGSLQYDSLTDANLHGWGRHHFLPFLAAVHEDGVEADFMGAMHEILGRHGLARGLTPEVVAGFARPDRVNDKDGALLVALCRRFAARIKDQFADAEKPNELRRAAYLSSVEAISHLGIVDPPYAVLTPKRVARLWTEFAASNEAFAQAVWNRPWVEVMPPPNPAGLISTDLEESDDVGLHGHYAQALQTARPLFKDAIKVYREENRRSKA